MWKSCPSDPVPGRCADQSVSSGRHQPVCDSGAVRDHCSSLRLPFQQPWVSGSPGNTELPSLPYPKHLRGADWAYTLSGRAAVLHRNGLGIAHLLLGPALHTIRFQKTPPNSL